jgi:hypothetical protein
VVVLRATKRVLQRLPPAASGEPGPSDTALGDWYVNRFVVDRQPLLIFVSSTSLLSILTPARNLRTLPERLPALVADRLQRLRVEFALVDDVTAELTSWAADRMPDAAGGGCPAVHRARYRDPRRAANIAGNEIRTRAVKECGADSHDGFPENSMLPSVAVVHRRRPRYTLQSEHI